MHSRLLGSRDEVHVDSYNIRPLDNEYIKSIDSLPCRNAGTYEPQQKRTGNPECRFVLGDGRVQAEGRSYCVVIVFPVNGICANEL